MTVEKYVSVFWFGIIKSFLKRNSISHWSHKTFLFDFCHIFRKSVAKSVTRLYVLDFGICETMQWAAHLLSYFRLLQFHCSNGETIHKSWVFDGKPDEIYCHLKINSLLPVTKQKNIIKKIWKKSKIRPRLDKNE